MTLSQLEAELKKLLQMPLWGKKQTDDWDKLSNFVYQLPGYESLLEQLQQLNKGKDFDHYVLHRWYNTLSARAVEQIFCSCEGVLPNLNQYDKLVDFTIKGIAFDLKTAVFPQGYPNSLEYAQQQPKHLIEWLYRHQSQEQRFHRGNRLFLLLWANDGEHWKLRAEISKIKNVIHQYVQKFEEKNLKEIHFDTGEKALSDILWFRA